MDPMTRPLSAVVVAGTHSGAGKTTVTLGLIGALRRRGLVVQPFKVGPDFIDPLHHAQASGRAPRNLDGWMLGADVNRERFHRFAADADAAVIEGVMGLFDGREGGSDRGSAADLARTLGLPIVLVIDAGAMARSAAALIHGFTTFAPDLRFAGVVLNNVGSPAHVALIVDAVAGRVPILGALPRVRDLVVPERHLGLYLPHESRVDYAARLADLVTEHLDVDALLAAGALERVAVDRRPAPAGRRRARIAVARDEAICFYYEDNLDALRRAGAELVEFSPLRDPLPDACDGLYVGGGYPELHAPALAARSQTRATIGALAAAGAPVYGECGGLMYLGETLEVDGEAYPMCGVVPLRTRMPARLAIGYVEVTTTGGLFGAGATARGHLFHHSEIDGDPPPGRCYEMRTSSGEIVSEGYGRGNVLASYAHLHFASSPDLAERLVDAAERFRAARG